MNCSNKFKLTAVAMMVGTAMNANAALYQVIEVVPQIDGNTIDTETAQTSYGVAIQQGDVHLQWVASMVLLVVRRNSSNLHLRLVLHLSRQGKL